MGEFLSRPRPRRSLSVPEVAGVVGTSPTPVSQILALHEGAGNGSRRTFRHGLTDMSVGESWMKLEFTEAEVNERVAPFAAVLAQEEYPKEAGRLCASERRWGTRREMRARALKWHGDRCTFEIAVRTESGWHHVIGKVYKTDRSDVFQAMEALRRAGFSEDAEFSIPQPLVYLSSLGVRLEEKVRGPSAKDLFLNGGPHEHIDRKSTRLNSSHRTISYAVFCLKKKKNRPLLRCG